MRHEHNVMLGVVILIVNVLNAIFLTVTMPSLIIMAVLCYYAFCQYTECCYAGVFYVECRCADCRVDFIMTSPDWNLIQHFPTFSKKMTH
jgi:hypothetical protein